jgi:UDP-N-acetylglucosamine--N-acetylmuramyl-(pentapeptide) pyrophosphoryl-undecaprenol N-acetylglucosamine transferase
MLAGGGTGGHIFPAIYIAQYLKKNWGAQCIFIGTKKGMENLKISQAGFVVKHIWIRGFKRGFYLSNLLFPLRLIVSYWQSHREIQQFKPDLVIGTGGYISGPVLYRALKMKIPTAIQEQNSYPGITTRILASRVDRVFLAYAEALKYIKNIKKYVLVGNPIKDTIESENIEEARKYFDIDKGLTTILIFGGSQGARSINKAMDKIISEGTLDKVQIVWQTGALDFEIYKNTYKNNKNIRLHLLPFIDRMDYAYMIADFAICRAGAMTISELAAAGLPAILVPLPHAAANHQLKNAQTIVQGGGALVVEDNSEMEQLLQTAILKLLHSREQLNVMSEKIKSFHRNDTTQQIASELEKLLAEKSNESIQ